MWLCGPVGPWCPLRLPSQRGERAWRRVRGVCGEGLGARFASAHAPLAGTQSRDPAQRRRSLGNVSHLCSPQVACEVRGTAAGAVPGGFWDTLRAPGPGKRRGAGREDRSPRQGCSLGGGREGETGSPGHGWEEGHVGSACPPPHVPERFCVGRQSRPGLCPSRTRRGHRSLARSFQRGPLGAAGRPGLWGMKSFSCGSRSQSARPGLAARRVWLCGQRYFQCLHRVCVSEAARLGGGGGCMWERLWGRGAVSPGCCAGRQGPRVAFPGAPVPILPRQVCGLWRSWSQRLQHRRDRQNWGAGVMGVLGLSPGSSLCSRVPPV